MRKCTDCVICTVAQAVPRIGLALQEVGTGIQPIWRAWKPGPKMPNASPTRGTLNQGGDRLPACLAGLEASLYLHG